MSTPAEHTEALAWVQERLTHAYGLEPYYRLAEAVLTRHTPDTRYPGERERLTCAGCLHPAWPCPDVEPPLDFVKAVRG